MPTEWEAGWASGAVLDVLKEENSVAPAGTRTSDRPARSLITIATTVSRPPNVFCEVKSL